MTVGLLLSLIQRRLSIQLPADSFVIISIIINRNWRQLLGNNWVSHIYFSRYILSVTTQISFTSFIFSTSLHNPSGLFCKFFIFFSQLLYQLLQSQQTQFLSELKNGNNLNIFQSCIVLYWMKFHWILCGNFALWFIVEKMNF